MLHDSRSISYYEPSNVAIWMAMAFQGGYLNVGGFYACRQFVSHLTGSVTLVGIDLAKVEGNGALLLAIVPACFLSVVRTTHLSGIITDLGIGLVRVLCRKHVSLSILNDLRATYMRCGLIAFFPSGAFGGGEIFPRYQYLGFGVAVALSGTLVAVMVWKLPRAPSAAPAARLSPPASSGAPS